MRKSPAIATLTTTALLAFVLTSACFADALPAAPVVETQKSTQHTTRIDNKVLPYTATAGTLIIRNDEGEPVASMFYVAYTQKAASAKRPVTFFFNGGPGSASLWLNIGGFGPMHAVTGKVQPTGPAPYRITAHGESLLDKSDLVFLDAIGTGYSRPLGKAKGSDFWGVDSDVDAFARGIKRYVTLNGRWNSPKFLFGESYGTTRAAALVLKLQDQDMDFNGVVLMSTILNFADGKPGMDQDNINLLPSFAATARYHGKAGADSASLTAFLSAARAFASGPYATALAKGNTLPTDEKRKVAEAMSHFVGLPVDYLVRVNLRIGMEDFRKELLRSDGKIIGRFDARFTGSASDMAEHSDPARDDPATAGVSSAYLSAYREHLTKDLGYQTDLDYRALYNMVIEPAWDWHHKAPGIPYPLSAPDVALDLAAAMRSNPHLKVFSANGLYDLATPFFGTEFDLSHMFLPPPIRSNLLFGYYESGHMSYTDPDALKRMKADLAKFYGIAAP